MARQERKSRLPDVPGLLTRIQGEYLEMPGLKLTPAQARRLWGLELAECEQLLDHLVGSRFLKRTADGAYQRES
jgi:hypothetical protein